MMLIAIQTSAFWFMAGVTWVLQRLNYPLIGEVPAEHLPAYQAAHNKRFGLLMLPGVIVSFVTTILMFFFRPQPVPLVVPICQIMLLFSIVGSAANHAAPAHKKLQQGYNEPSHKLLINTNWLRLAAWLILGIGGIWLLNM